MPIQQKLCAHITNPLSIVTEVLFVRTKKSEINVNYGYWVIVICQCKLSNCLTNASLWWGVLMVGEAGYMRVQAIYRKSLYLLLSFTVNLKLL